MDSDYNIQHFIFENRLASFQVPQPVARRRASNAAGPKAPKTLLWPHKSPSPTELARAGFFFSPLQSNPDNVECFLCHKSLDGWEEDDSPLQEHLKHSSSCGWAICAAVDLELGDVVNEDPRLPYLLEARKNTFAGLWPYESKKGWKCKIKQLAEAGWQYTPTLESDDNTTCAYCQLSLDGWEAGDKPMDEHQKRSPHCPFFSLIAHNPAPKKTARGKTAHVSKASRLSVQSVATAASDTTSLADIDDSILTTTSTMTQGGRKTTRARKTAGATTARARKTRTRKDEPMEVLPDADADDVEIIEAPVAKPSRGKKRASNEMDVSHVAHAQAPAPKKRVIRGRNSAAVSDAPIRESHYAMLDPVPPVPDEAAIEAELRALERDMEIDEAPQAPQAPPEPETQEPQEPQEIQIPKKGRKTGARKVSKQTRKPKAAAPPPPPPSEPEVEEPMEEEQPVAMPEPEPVVEPEPVEPEPVEPEPEEKPKPKAKGRAKKSVAKPTVRAEQAAGKADGLHDTSIMSASSSGTASKGPEEEPAPPPKRGRGRPSKKSAESRSSLEKVVLAPVAQATAFQVTITPMPIARRSLVLPMSTGKLEPAEPETKTQPAPPPKQERHLPIPPSTPRAKPSPAGSARQAALSPSQSPQSSDAENQPPSSKPTTSATGKRVVLAPVAAVSTPTRTGSPSKRNNTLGRLQSTVAWTTVDVDSVFELDKENGDILTSLLRPGTDLDTPEKAMSVEEFIMHNAGQAERMLKEECEAMVSIFERQGTRAMQVIESLVVE